MKEGSRNGASLSEGILLGYLEGGSFNGDPERYVKEMYQEGCNNFM